jgi:hypothetical protein
MRVLEWKVKTTMYSEGGYKSTELRMIFRPSATAFQDESHVTRTKNVQIVKSALPQLVAADNLKKHTVKT